MSDGVVLEEEAAVDAAMNGEAEVLAGDERSNGEAVAAGVGLLRHDVGGAGLRAALVSGSAVLHHTPHVAGDTDAVACVLLPRVLAGARAAGDGAVAEAHRRRQLLAVGDDVEALGVHLVLVVSGVVRAAAINEAG